MKCAECGGAMRVTREDHQYVASGLPDVTLSGVEVRRCAACGEVEVVIRKIEQLHRAIARAVTRKTSRLTAAETRFLRRYLGWSGVDFARHMGVTAETVSRWENDREPVGPVADRLLRLMVVTREPVGDYSLETLAALEDRTEPLRVTLIAAARGGWKLVSQAA